MNCENRPVRKLYSHWQKLAQPQDKGDLHTGCPYGCIYCNQQGFDLIDGEHCPPYIGSTVDSGLSVNYRIWEGKYPILEIGKEALIKELGSYPFYTKTTPLLIQNFSDPSLSWGETIDTSLNIVDSLHHEGPFIYITKGAISQKYVNRFRELVDKKGVKPIFIVTNSALPKEIEPIPSEVRVKTIKSLADAGLPVIVSLRPLIKGINDDKGHLGAIIGQIKDSVSAITMGGLYVYDFTREAFQRAGYPLDKQYQVDPTNEFKIFREETRERVIAVSSSLGVEAPIYHHTTCATTNIMRTSYGVSSPDRLAHWARTEELFAECSGCPAAQRAICEQTSKKNPESVVADANKRLEEIGFPERAVPSEKPGTLLAINGLLHLSETFSITEACGWAVENLPSEERLSHVIHDVLESKEIDIHGTFSVQKEKLRWNVSLNDIGGAGENVRNKIQKIAQIMTRSSRISVS